MVGRGANGCGYVTPNPAYHGVKPRQVELCCRGLGLEAGYLGFDGRDSIGECGDVGVQVLLAGHQVSNRIEDEEL